MLTPTYQKDPVAIETQSFATIRDLVKLDDWSKDEQQVVMRMIHTTGAPNLADQIRLSAKACQAGREALACNKPILCDVEMVKQGLTKRMLTTQPLCFINDPQAHQVAQQTGHTRSMAAVSLWQEHLAGSIVVIGNAPTALFYLLDLLAAGAPKPALIVGIPVGFIGAQESKQALWHQAKDLGVEAITLLGRQGGSAVAASAVNSLLRCNLGEYY